jgi:hypothetical protein
VTWKSRQLFCQRARRIRERGRAIPTRREHSFSIRAERGGQDTVLVRCDDHLLRHERPGTMQQHLAQRRKVSGKHSASPKCGFSAAFGSPLTISAMMRFSLPVSLKRSTSSVTQADRAACGEQMTMRYRQVIDIETAVQKTG